MGDRRIAAVLYSTIFQDPPEVSFWGEEKHLKLMVVVVVLIYEYTKIYYFCCFNFIEVYLIYHVLVSGV